MSSEREVIEFWKTWHRELSDVLGCKFVETRVTLEAAKKLQAQLTAAQQQVDRLRELLRECDEELSMNLDSDHPLRCRINAELLKGK